MEIETVGETPATESETQNVDSEIQAVTQGAGENELQVLLAAQKAKIVELTSRAEVLEGENRSLRGQVESLKEESISHRLKAKRATEEGLSVTTQKDAEIAALSEKIDALTQAKERLELELSEAGQRLGSASLNLTRTQVALELGLPADLAIRIVGDSEAAIRDDAAKLKSLLARQQGTVLVSDAAPATTPVAGVEEVKRTKRGYKM